MCCSQNAKTWLAYVRKVENKYCQHYFQIQSCECLIFYRKGNQSVGIASHRPWCHCDSAKRIWKKLNLWSVLSGEAFHLEPKCEHHYESNFTARHQVNNIVKEQFYILNWIYIKLTELGLSAIDQLKDWTGQTRWKDKVQRSPHFT